MCASCSGQNQHIVKLFKMACLQYNSQKVPYKNTEFEREKMICFQNQLCDVLGGKLKKDKGLDFISQTQQLECNFILDNMLLMTDRFNESSTKNAESGAKKQSQTHYIQQQVNTTNNYFINGETITARATTKTTRNLNLNNVAAAAAETNTTIEQADGLSVPLTRNAQALKYNNGGMEQVQSHLNHLLDTTSGLRPKRKKLTDELTASLVLEKKQVFVPMPKQSERHRIEVNPDLEHEKFKGQSKLNTSLMSDNSQLAMDRPKTMHFTQSTLTLKQGEKSKKAIQKSVHLVPKTAAGLMQAANSGNSTYVAQHLRMHNLTALDDKHTLPSIEVRKESTAQLRQVYASSKSSSAIPPDRKQLKPAKLSSSLYGIGMKEQQMD